MKTTPAIISLIATLVTITIGMLAITGWFTHSDFLRSIIPGAVTMKFNVATAFVFSSIVLLLNYIQGKSKFLQLISHTLSAIVFLIGILTLIEYIFNDSLGIDEFFVKDGQKTTADYYAGRMSPLSAINFILIGIGLFLLNRKKAALYHFYYLLWIVFISLLMLVGFNAITEIPIFLHMAIHVAIGFITLSIAIWFAQPVLQKKISFKRTIFTGFTAVIILIAVISILAFYYSERRISTSKLVSRTNSVLMEAEQTLSLVKDIESGSRGYIITGDSIYLEYFLIAKKAIAGHVKNLETLTKDNPVQQTRIDYLSVLIDRRINFSLECIRLKNEKNTAAVNKLMATRQGKYYTDEIRYLTAAIQQDENNLLTQRQRENDKSIAAFNRTFFIFLSSIFILLLAILFSIKTNISMRRKAEKQGRESEEQIQTIFNAAPDAVIIINEEGKIVKWNPKSETMFGWTSGEVLDKLLSEIIIPPRYREAHQRGMKHFLKTGEGPVLGETIEIQALNKNNIEFDIALSISPTIINEKQFFIGFIRDITERIQAEERNRKQQQEIQDFIDSMSTLCAKIDTNGKFILVNKIAVVGSGLSLEQLLQTNFLEGGWWTFDPAVQERVRNAFKEACSGTAINYDESIFVFNQVLTVNFSLIPILKPDGAVDYIVGEARDITAQKKAEERIKESEQMFSTLFYKSPIMKAIAETSTGKYIEVNDAFADFVQQTKENIIGRTALELNMFVHPEERQKVMRRVERDGLIRNVEIEANSINGTTRWVSANIDKINLAGKDCYLLAAIDITQRKSIEEKVIKRTEQLKKSNEDMEAFSYSVSHDLRGPLRGIIGFAAILEEEYGSKLDDEAKRIISIIKNNTLTMGNLIDDLLSFSRMGRQDIIKSSVNTQIMVEEIIANLNTKNDKQNISWKIQPLPDMYGDISTLRQVWINFISNAIKYSRNTAQPIIEISSFMQEGQTAFQIKDNGVGFDASYKNKLFKVFQRLHSATEFEGTGVGLAIIEKIISKHGGKVWANGELGKGASFYFSLPNHN
jgi:PAS domain S-box-containing protein